MKKSIFLAIGVLILVVGTGIVLLIVRKGHTPTFHEVDPKASNFVTGGEINDATRKSGRFETTGGYNPIVLNVSACSKGADSVYFGLGHTEFSVQGKKGDACVFRYGTEVENPRWNGKLDTQCKVPSNISVSIALSDQGIDFGPISQYCQK